MLSGYTAARLALIALLFSGVSFAAQGQAKNAAGMLTCKTSASLGLIIGSHQKIRCRFTPNSGAPAEGYAGYINRLGLDLGITTGGVMSWAVLAHNAAGLSPGALAGKYVGASGDVSFGVGLGANALVGGSHRSVALQPVSLEGQVGVNLALGVGGLTLRSAH
jgi:hypothetical protein